MIEINAKLTRGPVYFTNETLKCLITFKNVISSNGQVDSKRNQDEMLAWAGVQIHCHCVLDETKVNFVPLTSTEHEQISISSSDTSFHPSQGERGHLVFSTKPKILFCDLKLMPNESKTFVYQEVIPTYAPPSYNGNTVKYLYKLTIGTQRVNAVIQLLRMPIRILSILDDNPNHNTNDNTNCDNHDDAPSELVSPSNQLLRSENKETVLDLALHKLDCLTARKSPNTFVITNQLGKVAKFSLLKSNYKIGEDIVGIFNFTEATVPCVQLSVTLQSEETILEESRAKISKSTIHTTSYSKYHEICLYTSHLQIVLPLPLTITPCFNTNIVSLSWKLHFEFVTTKNQEMNNTILTDSHGTMEQSPSNLNVQTMVWDLPITVYPTHPIQVARGFQIASSSTLTV